ncbi:MAG: hypothetical protein IKC36_03485 [Clostridia bacterium]|nr:hypothetical protein [Clostridia bacterium]
MKDDRSNCEASLLKRISQRIKKPLIALSYALVIFLFMLGLIWTGGENLMYNSVIMPIAGALGYLVFKWKAIYKLPMILLLLTAAACAFKLIEAAFSGIILMALIYSVLVAVGVAIAFLFHFALKREVDK